MESKRVNWSYRETSDLLDICLVKNVGKLMAMKRCKKRQLYSEIGTEMNRLGHGKSLEQVIVKFKNLCQKYRKGIPDNPSGNLNRKRFEMWSRMHEIFRFTYNLPIKKEPSVTFSTDVETNASLKDNENRPEINSLVDEIDPSEYENIGGDKEDLPSTSTVNEHLESPHPMRTKREFDQDEEVTFLKKPLTKADRNTANYLRCVRYLVDKFKSAQEDLQNKFYIQQLKLQQQQQEWEEKILDEEREFFAKILKATDARLKTKKPPNQTSS